MAVLYTEITTQFPQKTATHIYSRQYPNVSQFSTRKSQHSFPKSCNTHYFRTISKEQIKTDKNKIYRSLPHESLDVPSTFCEKTPLLVSVTYDCNRRNGCLICI